MKNYFIYLIAIFIVTSTLFIACEKEKSGDLSVIEVQNVEGNTSNIVTVKAVANFQGFYTYGDVIATSTFENNGFKLILPKTLSDKYLYADESGIISNSKAKIGHVVLLAYDNVDAAIGIFTAKGENSSISVNNLQYTYADRKCTMKGESRMGFFGVRYDCSFKKGWNIIYAFDDHSGTLTLTTQKLSDINLIWEFFNFESEDAILPYNTKP